MAADTEPIEILLHLPLLAEDKDSVGNWELGAIATLIDDVGAAAIIIVEGLTEYRNLDECLMFIEDIMIKQGPFDGLIGFSLGAILAAALPNLQAKGLALTRVPKVKCVVIIGGAMFQSPAMAEKAYSPKIMCPSLHLLGETDFLKKYGEALLESFVDPVVVRHPKGHTVPRLGTAITSGRSAASYCQQESDCYFSPQELEEKRKQRAHVTFERKKQLAKLRVKAEKAAEEKLGPQLEVLSPLKY